MSVKLSSGAASVLSKQTTGKVEHKRAWRTPLVIVATVDETKGKSGLTETHIGCVSNCVGPAS